MNHPQSTIPSATLTQIATMYGVHAHAWHAVEGGYRNVSYSFQADDGRMLNFILYKFEPESATLVARTNALGTYVARQGLPVRAPADERILRVGRRFGSLYSYLPGVTIPWEAYTMKHIKLLGFGLARFHEAAAGYGGLALPDVETIYEAITERMQHYFTDQHVVAALKEKLDISPRLPDFRPLLKTAKEMMDRTVLHMDMVRSNVLFSDATGSEMLAVGSVALSGILDLEKAAMGHPLFDIARTLAFLLVDCNKPETKIRKYFLRSGYVKRGGGKLELSEQSCTMFRDGCAFPAQRGDTSWQLEPSEPERNMVDDCSTQLLESLITMFLTYDFYKFLRQNPYESLGENYHFMRTCELLRQRNIL